MTILITPHFLSWVVVSYMAYAFLEPSYGIVNGLIESMGGEGISWYTEPSYWPVILAVFYVWKNAGYNSIVYYAALMGIDESLIEAAKIDGANRVQTFLRVTLPTIFPGVMSAAFLSFTMSFDDVVMSNMLAGARQSTLPVLILSMNKSGITPDVNALTTIMVLVIVTAMILNNIIQNSLKKKKGKN